MLIIFIIAALVFYIFLRLDRSNMERKTVANAEKPLGARAALQFAIDNNLPLK